MIYNVGWNKAKNIRKSVDHCKVKCYANAWNSVGRGGLGLWSVLIKLVYTLYYLGQKGHGVHCLPCLYRTQSKYTHRTLITIIVMMLVVRYTQTWQKTEKPWGIMEWITRNKVGHKIRYLELFEIFLP